MHAPDRREPDLRPPAPRTPVSEAREVRPRPAEPEAPLVMPGPKEIIAEEVAQVSPEGRPGDAKVGPKLLRLEVLGLLLVLVVVAVVAGLTIGWPAGLVAFTLGCLALLFLNPVLGASMGRAKDRQEVVDHHAPR